MQVKKQVQVDGLLKNTQKIKCRKGKVIMCMLCAKVIWEIQCQQHNEGWIVFAAFTCFWLPVNSVHSHCVSTIDSATEVTDFTLSHQQVNSKRKTK